VKHEKFIRKNSHSCPTFSFTLSNSLLNVSPATDLCSQPSCISDSRSTALKSLECIVSCWVNEKQETTFLCAVNFYARSMFHVPLRCWTASGGGFSHCLLSSFSVCNHNRSFTIIVLIEFFLSLHELLFFFLHSLPFMHHVR
jgi:hypothetical protein